jgi:hypothetical protein
MLKIASLTLAGAVLVVGLSTSFAQADDRREGYGREGFEGRRGMREVCSIVKRCRFDDGRRRCERQRVCKMVRRFR